MILLTGATGFLGKIIAEQLAAEHIVKLARGNAQINIDLSVDIPTINDHFDIIIHAAGKAHTIATSNYIKQDFFNVNVNGTTNLLRAIGNSFVPKTFVFISSVAVYGKAEGDFIRETESLSATDPYGLSKIKAEELITQWCLKNNVICTILRLPLIAGPNAPGNLLSMINGIKSGYYLNVAGGNARKSMVLANDVARIIIPVSKIGGVYNLTDGYHPSFYELSALISKQVMTSMPYNIPFWMAKILAKGGDIIGRKAPINSEKLRKITSNLTFDDSKARAELGWKPQNVLEHFKIR